MTSMTLLLLPLRPSRLLLGLLLSVISLASVPARALDISIPAGASEASIQAAIQKVSTSGGGTVQLAAGTWTLDTALALYSNVTLNGAGPTTILQGPDTPSGGALITHSAEGLNHVTVSNMTLDGRVPRSALYFNQFAPAPYKMAGVFIFAYNAVHRNITLSHLEIKNTVAGILMGLCDGVIIDHCNVHDNGAGFSHNIYLRACFNITVTNTKSNYSTLGDGIHIAGGGTGVKISHCEFIGNNGIGVLIQESPPGQVITDNLFLFNANEGLDTNGPGLLVARDRAEYNMSTGMNIIDPSSGMVGDSIALGNLGESLFIHGASIGRLMLSLTPNVYEAEYADGVTGPDATGDWVTTDVGYSGVGAVDFNKSHREDGAVTWRGVSVPATGTYPLVFRYANGAATPAALKLILNGVSIGNISFPPTGSWSAWKTVSISKPLKIGGNTVRVQVVGPKIAAPLLDSLQVTAPIPPAPSAPRGLIAKSASPRQINLSWNVVPGAGSYRIRRNGHPIASNVTSTTYQDSNIIFGGSKNTYVVSAVNAAGEGPGSIPATAVTWLGVPANATAIGGSHQVTLQVLASSGTVTYHVKRATRPGGPYKIIATIPNTGDLGSTNIYTTYIDKDVIPGTRYFYVFTALKPGGETAPTREVSATPS